MREKESGKRWGTGVYCPHFPLLCSALGEIRYKSRVLAEVKLTLYYDIKRKTVNKSRCGRLYREKE